MRQEIQWGLTEDQQCMKLVENNKSAVKSYKLFGPPHVQCLNWRIALSAAAKVECKIYRTNSSG